MVFDGTNLFLLTTAGPGNTLPAVSHWNGSAWKEVGRADRNGLPYALGLFGGDLYVLGIFESFAGVSTTNIARWNGTEWLHVPRVFALGSSEDSPLALQGTEKFLYAAGHLTPTSEVPSESIARFDGMSWSALDGGVGNPSGLAYVLNMASSAGRVAVIGSFKRAGTNASQNIAIWHEE